MSNPATVDFLAPPMNTRRWPMVSHRDGRRVVASAWDGPLRRPGYAPDMYGVQPGGFDLQGLLVQLERASPLNVVDVLAREFARLWQADAVSFLIVDYGGD